MSEKRSAWDGHPQAQENRELGLHNTSATSIPYGSVHLKPSQAPDLAPHHYAMLTEGSGIAPEVIAERGYRSIDGVDGYTFLKQWGFAIRTQCRLTPGLVLPLLTTDGQQAQIVYRPDKPRVDERRNRPMKYEIPKGAGVRLDCPPRCQPQLADPAIPLWITEGQKKADCLASRGACAIALLGVWNFKGKNVFGGNTFLADWDYVAVNNGRECRLVFDNDAFTIPEVRQALERLTVHLQRKGAVVRIVSLPAEGGAKVGVDDYLVAGHTMQDLEALIDAPRMAPRATPPTMELLAKSPKSITRPLTLVDGHGYAATWLWVRVTTTEVLNKHGEVVRLPEPRIEDRLERFIIRDDGALFGDVTDPNVHPLRTLDLQIHLAEPPPPNKLWSPSGVQAYLRGERPDPKTVFMQIVDIVGRFIDFNRSLADQRTMCELVACYILSTWFIEALTVIGFLWPNGERGSGKTQLLNVVTELAYLGQTILAGGSYASLRDLADYGACLAFDDAEAIMDVKRTDPDKRALLLAGNRRGSAVPVKEPVNGREWRTRYVNTFCPRLFSAIRMPDAVLASRTIVVPLIRTPDRYRANADPLNYALWPLTSVS
jgi:hypothetical protein